MHAIERLLLYAVSVGCAVLLFWGGESPWSAPSAGQVPSPRLREQTPPAHQASSTRLKMAAEREDDIVLADKQGRPRLELGLSTRGQPRLLMRNAEGTPVVQLEVTPEGIGRVQVSNNRQSAELATGHDGGLALTIRDEFRTVARFGLTTDGDVELVLQATSKTPRVVLLSDDQGTAEITTRTALGRSGPSLSTNQQGDAAIGILDREGEFGPVMHQFRDGLKEIAVLGDANRPTGPNMVLAPDGTSIISVRHANGQPATSMLTARDGIAVVAASNPQGSQQAVLRVDAKGNASFGVIEGEPQPPAVPDRPPRPRLPADRLIQNEARTTPPAVALHKHQSGIERSVLGRTSGNDRP